MADKPRYRGSIQGGVLNLQQVFDTVAEAQQGTQDHPRGHHRAGSSAPGKTRYRGQFSKGQLRVRPTEPPPPGRLSDVENEVLVSLGNQERGGPVQLTYFPTTTSNPADPRTAAAGYDPDTKTMRVEWGDGGPAYNYYDVTPAEWRRFQQVQSPGRMINRVFNYHPYGPA